MRRLRSRKDEVPEETPLPHKTPAEGISIYRPALLLFVLAATLLLTGIGVSLLVAGGHGASSERAARTAVSMLADRLDQAVSREQRQLAELAADESLVLEAVETGNVPDFLRHGFPGAAGLMVFPSDFNQASPTTNPPVGYALLDMMRTAEREAQGVPPEIHRPGGDESYVNFVQPLTVDGAVTAHLVAIYPGSWLTQNLELPFGGRLVLEQRDSDGRFAPMLEIGQGEVADQTFQAPIQGVPWRLQLMPEPLPWSWSLLTEPLLLGIAGAGLLILAGGFLLVFSGLRQRLEADAAVWQVAALDAARGEIKADYPVTLRELRNGLGPVVALRKDSDRTGSPKSAAKGSGTKNRPKKAMARTEVVPGDNDRSRRGKSIAAPTGPDRKDLLSGLNGEEEMPKGKTDAPTATPEFTPVDVDRTLFRAYDIRGVVGKGLSVDVVRTIGRAIGSEAAARAQAEVVVARDGRLSSPELANALMDGLRSTGVDVIDIGCVPTPVMYFATYHLGTGSGVVVTGSHNPPDYNGMKIMLAGETLSGDAIAALHTRIERGDLVDGHGGLRQQDVVPDYLQRIVEDVSLHRPMRVVVDCGNGVAGNIAPEVMRALGCEVTELFCDVDGTFPNHHPDPSDPANLEDLINTVRQQEADVGLAFDGDGDRLGVVDTSGKIIWPDRQMMLYAADILAREPGSDIIFDVKCSSHLARTITQNAGVPVMWRTGHSLIKAKLKESGAPLAGEMSGHIFFNDRWDGFDDGIYTAARLLEILAMDGRSSTEIFAELPETVSTPELKIALAEGEPPEVIRRLVGKASFSTARVTTIDGLRVDFPDGWGLVRASNTTPCLVLRFEADDEKALERIKQAFRDLLDKARPGLDTNF